MDYKNISVKGSFCRIDLNDLPRHFTAMTDIFCLGETKNKIKRDKGKIEQEYGKEKWGFLRQRYASKRFSDPREAFVFVEKSLCEDKVRFHVNEEIYLGENIDEWLTFYYAVIDSFLREYVTADSTLIELGCGWGRVLINALLNGLCSRAVGGEYMADGIQLGNRIGRDFDLPLQLHSFDYYQPDFSFTRETKDNIVLTCNSIEQIPFLPEDFIIKLIELRPRAVMHFEPVFEHKTNDSTMHLIWKRYALLNDYNQNLLTLLKKYEEMGKLRITIEVPNAFGINGLNSGSFIAWEAV